MEILLTQNIKSQAPQESSLLLPVHETPWRSHDIIVHIAIVVQRNTAAHGKEET